MRKSLMVCVAAATAFLGVGSAANAQSFYFGFGSGHGGGGHYYDHGRHHRDHYYRAPRVYAQPHYPAYSYRSYSDCYWVTKRHYNDYHGGWVVRRVRVCD